MDNNRVAGALSGGSIFVFDIPSGLSTGSFATPTTFNLPPSISGSKIVVAAGTGITSPTSIYYCTLPQAAPIAPCPPIGPGSWTAVAVGPNIAFLAANGLPAIKGNLIVWPVTGGLAYFQFTTGTVVTILLAAQPSGISTNGFIIAFVSGGTLQYLDTTSCGGPCGPANVVDTLLPAAAGRSGVSQNIIAFNEPGPPLLVRYYDFATGIASPAGAGPIGTLSFAGAPKVWGDRIVFTVSETDLGFDCNGVNGISSTELCMRYWNIQNPVALLAPKAAPPSTAAVAVYDRFIAFVGQSGTLQYVRVPMTGDVNQDGVVDIQDISAIGSCWQQVLKHLPPPASC